jgi:hypothetical protein
MRPISDPQKPVKKAGADAGEAFTQTIVKKTVKKMVRSGQSAVKEAAQESRVPDVHVNSMSDGLEVAIPLRRKRLNAGRRTEAWW